MQKKPSMPKHRWLYGCLTKLYPYFFFFFAVFLAAFLAVFFFFAILKTFL
jgi:hypothetical protein